VRTNDAIEAVSWGASSIEFYEDLFDWHKAKVIINLTSVDVNAAMAAVRAKLSYVGIVWTDAHKEMFLAEMLQRVFSSFQDESSPLYEPELVQILGRKNKKPKKASGRVGVGDLGLRSVSSSKLHCTRLGSFDSIFENTWSEQASIVSAEGAGLHCKLRNSSCLVPNNIFLARNRP
jgi:hypothetical protein